MESLMKTITQSFTIVNRLGLHARAAALFVKTASRFKSDIYVIKGKNRINGKSIMGILMLAAAQGSRIKVEANGIDAEMALDKLGKLILQGFHEK